MRDVFLGGQYQCDGALRVAQRLVGDVNIHKRTILALTHGLVGSGTDSHRVMQNASGFVQAILGHDQFVQLLAHGFGGAIAKHAFGAIVPVMHYTIYRGANHCVRQLVEQ